MTVPAILDRNQDVRVIRGATFRLVMKIKRKDGTLVDLTGMSFRWSVFDARSVMHAVIPATGAGTEVVFPMTGEQSAALTGIGLKHQVDQIVEDGVTPWLAGSFTTSIGPTAATGTGASSDILAQVAEASGVVIVSATGAPGLSLTESLGTTPEELIAELVTTPVAIKLAQADTLLAAAVGRSDAAIDDLSEAAAAKFSEVDDQVGATVARFEGKVDGLVTVLEPQVFTPQEQSIARDNIGAVDQASLDAVHDAFSVAQPTSGVAVGNEASVSAPSAVPTDKPYWVDFFINGILQYPGVSFTSDGSQTLTLSGFTLTTGDTWLVRQYQRNPT